VAGTAGRTKAWFWVLGAVIVALVVALVVVLVTQDDDDETPAAATSSTATSTTLAATTTTVHAASTTAPTTAAPATTVPLPVITDDPQTYAQYLFAAWQNGNRSAAAEVANADAVTQMFSQAYPAKGPYTFANCDPAAGTLYCNWNGQNGATIQMAVRTLTGGLPIQVQSVTFSP